MTVNVRSRAIDRLILKIDKNVKSTEFDHNGVCPSGYKHLVLLFQCHFRLSLCQSCQKVVAKKLPKWNSSLLFLYLLVKTKTLLKLHKLGHSSAGKSFENNQARSILVVNHHQSALLGSTESSLKRPYEFRSKRPISLPPKTNMTNQEAPMIGQLMTIGRHKLSCMKHSGGT